jgi:cytochrome c biogenesis protein
LVAQMDPGVAPVYAGFGGLMLTTVISYLSHSQVWALQEGTSLVVGGKSNRARFEFEKELNEILDCVPEIRTKKQRGDFSSTETATQKQ